MLTGQAHSSMKLFPMFQTCFKSIPPFFSHFISSLLLTPFHVPILSSLSSFLPIHCLFSLSLPSYPLPFNLYLSFTSKSILPCPFLPLLFFLTPIFFSLLTQSSALPFLVYHLLSHSHHSSYPFFPPASILFHSL